MRRIWRAYFRRAIFVALALAAAPAFGGDEEVEDLEMEMFFAPAETVTSAARHIQPLTHSPSAVTVLTRDDIEASGARTLPEVLRLVPNMDANVVKPLWYNMGVRGGTTNSSDTMLLLIDGRDATMEFFGFPLWAAYPVSMDEVERIEVIRGPGSALYGANAFSGVVHVIMREPGTAPLATASFRGGERGHSELTWRASESLGPVDLSAGMGLVRDGLWSGPESGRERIGGWLKGKTDFGQESSLVLELGGFLVSGTLHSDLGEIGADDALNSYARGRFEYEDLMVQFVYERLDFFLDLGMELYDKGLGLSIARVPKFDCDVYKINVQVQHSVEVLFNRFTYGTEYVFNTNSGEALIPTDHKEHRFGIYAQDEVKLDEILKDTSDVDIFPVMLTAGMRFDYNSVTDYELSPRAALVLIPFMQHSFRLGYAHAFLKPTSFESSLRFKLISDWGFDEMSVANDDLQNQKIDSLELGYGGSFLGGRLVIRVDLAYNWYSNQIGFMYDPSKMEYKDIAGFLIPDISGPGINFINNPSGTEGHDVELQIITKPTDRSRLYFQAGYRQVFDSETGAFSEREPVWRLGAGADFSSAQDWTVSLRWFYVSAFSRELPDRESVLEPTVLVRLPASWFLNARISKQLSTEPFDLSVGIEGFNLLNHRFREHAGEPIDNKPDYGGELLGRRIVLFLRGQIW